MDLTETLAHEFGLRAQQVENVVALIDDGNTIPFIARYRKEKTGSLDDQVLRALSERLEYLRGLDSRREEVFKSVEAQGKLTPEFRAAVAAARTLTEIDDLYRPFRPKRRTRAGIAKERGLGPLADAVRAQEKSESGLLLLAGDFIDEEKGVGSAEEALAGALDILAEEISDAAALRKALRALALREGVIVAKRAKEGGSVYEMYYDYRESAAKIPGHRILAVDRGEREEFLKVSLELDEEKALLLVSRAAEKPGCRCPSLLRRAEKDAWSRLIFPSIEREVRGELTGRAQEQAVRVFALNLRQLLLQPPVRGRVTMGLDPAYRTGCKVAVVDRTGKVLETGVVYPTPPQNRVEEAKAVLRRMIKAHGVTAVSIGNGTASRETERFAADLLHEFGGSVEYMVVSEAGASVYSASKLAAGEFPEYDVSLRSAVSIARRLQDPLAELIKIDPKAIGVGQYQHDLKPARLDEALGGVVEDCANSVGVDLNTASVPLLSHISGISAAVAKNIVAAREETGGFTSRSELKKVPKLGPKAFEQCAGFLRIPESGNVLDNTSVHPESYKAAEKLLKLSGLSDADVRAGRGGAAAGRIAAVGEEKAAAEAGVGLPTLRDILQELAKPGRDPRDELPPPLLRTDVLELSDLKPGMELSGTVRNVVDFGAFVDIGVHQDGLVHLSQLADRFVRHPSEVVRVGDIVKVRVLSVDPQKKRISLTMKSGEAG